MARTKRSAKLDTRSARMNLAREERHVDTIQPGRYIIYQRPKGGAAGSWLARWLNPQSKKQKQIKLGVADDYSEADGISTLTFSQAQMKAQIWFGEQDQIAHQEATGEVLDQGPFTVASALDQYFANGERLGKKGLSRDRQRANAWIYPELGEFDVATLTQKQIEKWLDRIAAAPRRVRQKSPETHVPKPRNFKNPRPCKEKTTPPAPPITPDEKRARKDSANRTLTILKAALNYALSEQRIKHGEAWQRVKPFRGTTSARLRFLSDEEQLRLVNTCPNGFRELVQGALLTGCRYGELARLQVRDYNANAGTVFIAESKSGKSRHVFLTEEGKTLFEAQTAGRPTECFIFEQERKRRKRLNLGKHWGHGDASKIMKDVCKLAEIESLTFHELRHTYASKLVNKGVPLAYVAAQLGHSTTRMVEKHYGHLAPSAMAEAIRAALPSLGLVQKSKIQTLKVSGNKE